MKIILITVSFLFCKTTISLSQVDTIPNSLEYVYKTANPEIKYVYDFDKQIHNYSGNWDLDNDSKLDSIYFIGTGGAHLYYSLKIILSSDNAERNFSYIESDFPVLPGKNEISKKDFNLCQQQFAVLDYNYDNQPDVFIKLDKQSFESSKDILRKKGIKTNYILISFKKAKVHLKDLVSCTNQHSTN